MLYQYSNQAQTAYYLEPSGKDRAYLWDLGVLLASTIAASKAMPAEFDADLQRLWESLDQYWSRTQSVWSYPASKGGTEVYYDDNEWVGISLCEAYSNTHQSRYLERAKQVFEFLKTGEDEQLGGGIYWIFQPRNSKNTCSNAPAAVFALRLYQITHSSEYLEFAKRIVAWTNRTLRDPKDGLFWDNIVITSPTAKEKHIEKTKWSYNSALMIRANYLLATITRDNRYLDEAMHIAESAVRYWYKPEEPFTKDDASFGHLLCESLFDLKSVGKQGLQFAKLADQRAHWALENCKDENGWYGKRWTGKPVGPSRQLLWQASMARLHWTTLEFEASIK